MVHGRDLDKQEAEIREKLKQEKKREERKNREAFSELLREDMDEGFIKPKMRWKVRRSCLLLSKCIGQPVTFRSLCVSLLRLIVLNCFRRVWALFVSAFACCYKSGTLQTLKIQ